MAAVGDPGLPLDRCLAFGECSCTLSVAAVSTEATRFPTQPACLPAMMQEPTPVYACIADCAGSCDVGCAAATNAAGTTSAKVVSATYNSDCCWSTSQVLAVAQGAGGG